MPKLPDDEWIKRITPHLSEERTLTGRLERRGTHMHCEVHCNECGKTQWIEAQSIVGGKSSRCVCLRCRKYPKGAPVKTLGERYDAMVQRCTRDTHVSSHHYKGRGIKVLFKSRQHFIDWALMNWSWDEFKGKDFDRIDNDGHYEPENLRLVTRHENLMNRRNTVFREDEDDCTF